jgi:hypothetical protein
MDTFKMTQIRKTTMAEKIEAIRAFQEATRRGPSRIEKACAVVSVVATATIIAALASPLLAFIAAGIAASTGHASF